MCARVCVRACLIVCDLETLKEATSARVELLRYRKRDIWFDHVAHNIA